MWKILIESQVGWSQFFLTWIESPHMHNVGVLTPDDLRPYAKYKRLIPNEVVAYAVLAFEPRKFLVRSLR